MEYVIVGLGNPGEEYVHTRHNLGRMVVEALAERWGVSDWRNDLKLHAKVSQGSFAGADVVLVLPDTYMNRSGASVSPLVKGKKQLEQLVVVHDDIDLPIGTTKIVFNRGSGGHRGVESIDKALHTKEYMRVRVGVIPLSPSGTLKKPKGADKVHDFILKKISKKDLLVIEEVVVRVCDAIEVLLSQGVEAAMRTCNSTK